MCIINYTSKITRTLSPLVPFIHQPLTIWFILETIKREIESSLKCPFEKQKLQQYGVHKNRNQQGIHSQDFPIMVSENNCQPYSSILFWRSIKIDLNNFLCGSFFSLEISDFSSAQYGCLESEKARPSPKYTEEEISFYWTPIGSFHTI